MMKSALAFALLACAGYGRRVQVQLDTEAAAAFNPSTAGTSAGRRVSASNPSLTGSRPQVLDGFRAPAAAKMAVVVPLEQQKDESITPEKADDALGKPLAVGVSWKTATVEVREKLAVPENQWNEVSAKLVEFDSIDEAAIISTCNRFEIYIVTRDRSAAQRDLVSFLSKRAGLTEDEMTPLLFTHWDEEATWHLLKVAGGLDSLVLGEYHILSQIKAMAKHAQSPASEDEPAGSAREVLSRLLTSAVYGGKAVRVETSIGEGQVSISSAGVDLAIMRAPFDLGRAMVDLEVAIIGAGTMGRSFLMNLQKRGLTRVTVVNRSPERPQALAAEWPHVNVNIKLMDEFWPAIETADLVMTATSSADPIITKDELSARLGSERKMMLIDISVPRNIEAECNDLPNVFSYNVDDLKQVQEANQKKRLEQVVEAEKILHNELTCFHAWQSTAHYANVENKMMQKRKRFVASALADAEEKGILATLDDKQRKSIRKAFDACAQLFVRYPLGYFSILRKEGLDGTEASVRQLEELLGLSSPQMVEADSEEQQLYTPLWESLTAKVEAERMKQLTGKKSLVGESFPRFDDINRITRTMVEDIFQDTKKYIFSHLVDGTKLRVDELEHIYRMK